MGQPRLSDVTRRQRHKRRSLNAKVPRPKKTAAIHFNHNKHSSINPRKYTPMRRILSQTLLTPSQFINNKYILIYPNHKYLLMDIKRYRYSLPLLKLSSFTQAAKAAGVSPTSVSHGD